MFLIACLETLAKGVKFCIEYDNFKRLIYEIYEPLDKIERKNNAQVMKWINEIARSEHRQFIFLSGTVMLLFFARIFSADFKSKEFPVRAYFPFDATVSLYYHSIYIAISYCVLLVDCSLVGVDMTGIVLLRYLNVQLEILTTNFRHCRNNSIKRPVNLSSDKNFEPFRRNAIKNASHYHNDDEDDDDYNDNGITNFVIFEIQQKAVNNNDNFDWRLKHCILHHQKVIRMLNRANNCFSFCVIVQILATTVLTCLNGFQIIVGLQNSDLHELTRRVLAIVVVLLQLLLWCWYGNKLSTAADSLTVNLWMSGWEDNYKYGLRNSICIPMTLSLQSIEVSAAGVVPLSLQTFVSAIKTSYSVLVLLLTVAKDQ